MSRLRQPAVSHADGAALSPGHLRYIQGNFAARAEEALNVLVEIMHDTKADRGHRIAAAKEVLNRGLGQAPSYSVVKTDTEIRHTTTVSVESLKAMDSGQLQALISTLGGLLAAPEGEGAPTPPGTA